MLNVNQFVSEAWLGTTDGVNVVRRQVRKLTNEYGEVVGRASVSKQSATASGDGSISCALILLSLKSFQLHRRVTLCVCVLFLAVHAHGVSVKGVIPCALISTRAMRHSYHLDANGVAHKFGLLY